MPKTATTFLQSYLFHRHSQVNYLGKNEGLPRFCSPQIEQTVRCLRDPAHPGLFQFHDQCRDAVARIGKGGKITVFSDEAFTYGNRDIKHKQAELFKSFFGTCRILLTIREPLSLMETLYLQELRGYHYNKSVYRRLVKIFGAPPRFFSIEDWLDANWSFPQHGAFSHLQMGETAEAYAEVFGKENVLIKPYEAFKQDNLAFVRRLSEEIGIDAAESEQLCANQNTSKNSRWKQIHVDRLKQFNRSPLLRWQYRWFKNVRDLKQFLGVMGPDKLIDSPMARAEIPTVWRERILQIGREQFTRLKRRWDLPLENFGYPVSDDSQDGHSVSDHRAA
jgi:hypothetical protein